MLKKHLQPASSIPPSRLVILLLSLTKLGHGEKKRFTVRKMSGTVGVERIFPIESPNIDSIEVNKVGKVRRAKLYYLRKLTGKAARIKEKRSAIIANNED